MAGDFDLSDDDYREATTCVICHAPMPEGKPTCERCRAQPARLPDAD